MNRFLALCALLGALALTGCAKPVPYDYTAFKQSRPKSILVLPPVNHSPDVKAGYSSVSQVTYPLAESGYYVLPVAVVDETFKQNGLTAAEDIQAVSAAKLHQIFGADAALYLVVEEYGTRYLILDSETHVSVTARLVDLRTGALLWNGGAVASTAEKNSNSGGNIVGMLVAAAVKQITSTMMDEGHEMAGVASGRLLSAGQPRGILYGPRSLQYGKEIN